MSASPAKPAAKPSRAVDPRLLQALLNDGVADSTAPAGHKSGSPALVAAAAGADDQQFYRLGELLVLGEHFKFLWTIYPNGATAADCWPGSDYVDYVGTDILDWYGGPNGTYPHTASGALDWTLHWQQTLTAAPGGLDWMARFSQLTGKPIIIPEWGLDFHTFGGQDDTYFLAHMTAWLKAHHAIGLYWVQSHVTRSGWPGGPLLADVGASAQVNSPLAVNGMGKLLGGHLRYAGVYLIDREMISDATAQPILAPWENAGYRLVLSVDIIPNPPVIKPYSGPPEPGGKPYRLSEYPDAVAALRQGLG